MGNTDGSKNAASAAVTVRVEPSEGRAVNLRDKEKFAWYRKQTVNGHEVLVALIKPGVKTDSNLDAERGLPPGNILMVTFPFGDHRDHAANFVGKYRTTRKWSICS